MINQQMLEGKWNEIRGRLQERFGDLTDDDLKKFDGNVQELVGLIQRKTGEAREKIATFLDEIANGSTAEGGTCHSAREYAEQAAKNVSEYAEHLGASTQEAVKMAKDQARAGYIQTERLVRQRPFESLAVCFGAGLITGVVVGLLVRSK